MKPLISTLDNGVRVVTLALPRVESISLSVWADAGSRYETTASNGLAHFLEHLLFKGTPTRSSRRISEEVEGVGGDINAQTSEERTCFYATAPAIHGERVARVLLDLYANPRMAPRDIELERGVIAEEIMMYRDEPDQHVHELLSEIFWPEHPIGRPIAGSLETIASFERQHFVDFREKYHHAGRTLVAAAGAVDHDRLVRLADKALRDLPPKKALRPPKKAPAVSGGVEILFEQRETNQTHVSIGLPGVSDSDEDRFAAGLLMTMLGGNSSSRLFQELRERRGWCYGVSTSGQSFRDTGMTNLAIGLEGGHLEKCLQIVCKIFREFREAPCRPRDLQRAQEYGIGLSKISLERSATQCSRIAQSLLIRGRVVDFSEMEQKIRGITPEDIQRVARRLLRPEQSKLALIGPSANPGRLKELLSA